MDFIIMDLEWNNTYARKTKGFINEIIEIGAVKLDENLNFKDKFSCLVRPQIGKKLRGSVKELTNITNEEVRSGEQFTKVFSSFRRWIGSECVLLTWGDGDIRVLIDNYKYLNGINTVPFLSYYADMQAYIQSVLGTPKSRQIGLSTAAQELGIDESSFSHHRAYDDSLLSAECLKKVYSKDAFKPYIRECNDEFYARLTFKAHPISNIHSPLIDKSVLDYKCEICSGKCEQTKQWSYSNQYFR
ncbi:MAG: 3'-5' exonuclease, partial [Acutalibacteraceae bacterium]|nr:3'-5' exonuclease [Acutalibacteraceae bacterium]